MSRVHRPQMPGIAFHITARTQGREKWFTDQLKPAVERIIIDGITSSDAWFLSHTVMDNHFHIVLRQGARPLGWIMQPVMRRISLLVQRSVGIEGHVFERRFRSHACENADWLRRAIVYTNLNARRARLCQDPADYAWSSHAELLCEKEVGVRGIRVTHTLKLFAHRDTNCAADLRTAYLNYVKWRIEKDEHDAAGLPFAAPEPVTDAGDAYFATSFCALPPLTRQPQRDLRDAAADFLYSIDPACTLDELKTRRLDRHRSAVRRELIAALLQAGYRGYMIADFLRLSDSAISLVATRIRFGTHR